MDGFQWPACDVCGQSVPRANGRLLLKEDDVTEYWDYQITNAQEKTGLNQGQEQNETDAMSVNGVPYGPDTMPWRWGHEECLPDSRYMVVAKKFGNIRMLLDWILSPSVDDLVGRTNWRETARRLNNSPAS